MQNYLKNKSISIAGAGIAGLISALILKKNGFQPILYEKSSHCGKNRYGDFEGLETWNFNSNPIQKLNKLGIKTKFNYNAFDHFDIHIPEKQSIQIKSPETFFYMIRRGNKPGDIDYEFQKQAQDEGIEINFNTKLDIKKADIIATGSKNAKAYIQGVVFKTSLHNQVHLILGNQIAPYGYGYLIIIDGEATLAVAYKNKDKKHKYILNNILEYSSNYIGINIPNYKEFSGYGSFSYKHNKKDDLGRLYIGEAGGFQDYLFGFGIQYAIESAVLAAESYINNQSFDILWEKKLRSYMKVSYRNRKFFEKLNDQHFYLICKQISKVHNPVDLLRKRCQPGVLDKILNFI